MTKTFRADESVQIAIVKAEIGRLAFYLRFLMFGFRKFFVNLNG